MVEGCYSTIKDLLSRAREFSKNPISPLTEKGKFYEEVRIKIDRPDSYLAVRLLANGSPIYLLNEKDRYFRLGRVKEIMERYPRTDKWTSTDDKKLGRLDLLPITCEEAIGKALEYPVPVSENSKRAA